MPKTQAPAPSRVEELRETRARCEDALVERRGNVALIDTEIAAMDARLHANDARRNQIEADRAALPERLRRARADVLISPTPTNEQRVHDLESAEGTLNATLDEIAAMATDLHAERERLTAERDAAAELIPPLEQRLEETTKEIGDVRFAEVVEHIDAARRVVTDKRQQLSDAHRTLEEMIDSERAALDADGLTYLTHRPELASIVGPNAPTVRVLSAFIDFLHVLLAEMPRRSEIRQTLGPDQYLSAALCILPGWVDSALNYEITDMFTGKLAMLEAIRERIEREPVVSWGGARQHR